MFPPQTSLIPVMVALSRFLEAKGPVAFNLTYPYWYLGMTPFRFLVGPIIPILTVLIHKLIPSVILFDILIVLIVASFFISAGGWGLLSAKISGSRKVGVIVATLLLIAPWRYFSGLTFDEPSNLISRNLVPLVLVAIWNLLAERRLKNWLIATASLVLALLINTQVLPIVAIGATVLILAKSFKEGRFKGLSKYIKTTLTLLALGLGLVTIWYTPDYWLTLLVNPGIGGASGARAIVNLFGFLRASLPVLLALVAVYFWAKIKDRFAVFGLSWFLAFFLISFFRLLANPHFWTDWTSWGIEIEVGIALLIAGSIEPALEGKKFHLTYGLYWGVIILFLCFVTITVWKSLGKPALVTPKPPRALRSLAVLAEVVQDRPGRVFVSGSTVFWLNAFYDLPQLRGGRDEVSSDPNWLKASYEFREGTDPALSRYWLEKLGIDYVLVHSEESAEYYHDFKSIDKWEELGVKVWTQEGDTIYAVKRAE